MNNNCDMHLESLYNQVQFLHEEMDKLSKRIKTPSSALRWSNRHKELVGRVLSCCREIDRLEGMIKE